MNVHGANKLVLVCVAGQLAMVSGDLDGEKCPNHAWMLILLMGGRGA